MSLDTGVGKCSFAWRSWGLVGFEILEALARKKSYFQSGFSDYGPVVLNLAFYSLLSKCFKYSVTTWALKQYLGLTKCLSLYFSGSWCIWSILHCNCSEIDHVNGEHTSFGGWSCFLERFGRKGFYEGLNGSILRIGREIKMISVNRSTLSFDWCYFLNIVCWELMFVTKHDLKNECLSLELKYEAVKLFAEL